ncbi:MAG TPA: hypothetical protein DD471_14190, partial [Planctomycetes bacterium]|nr:hypothetical protein [Planctomycetota bacterium]
MELVDDDCLRASPGGCQAACRAKGQSDECSGSESHVLSTKWRSRTQGSILLLDRGQHKHYANIPTRLVLRAPRAFLVAAVRVDFSSMKKKGDRKKGRGILAGLALAFAGVGGWVLFDRPAKQPGPAALWREEVAVELGSLPRRQWGASEDVQLKIALGKPVRITIHHSGGAIFTAIERDLVGSSIKAIQN